MAKKKKKQVRHRCMNCGGRIENPSDHSADYLWTRDSAPVRWFCYKCGHQRLGSCPEFRPLYQMMGAVRTW